MVAGGFTFSFHVTRVTFACLEMDITSRKRSKIIALNEHTTVTVRDIATIVGGDKSSVLRILRTFQDSCSSSPKRKGKRALKRKITPRIDKILIRNSKVKQSKTSTDNRRNLLHYGAEVRTSIVLSIVLGSEGRMNYVKYIEKVLSRIVSSMETSEGTFQHALASSHNSISVHTFMWKNKIKMLNWPGNFPDLNPIKKLKHILKNRLSIFDVKDAPHISRPVVEKVDKIPEIIEVDRQRVEAAQMVAKPGLASRKALLCNWWDWKEIIDYELLPTNSKKKSGDSRPLDENDLNEFAVVHDNKEVDTGDVEGKVERLTADLTRDDLKFATSKGQHIITHDPDIERALKFQNNLV
ncbi:HTH_Tnp_Tc3_2 domain-containing protein [Trichonephila clavipes]|nr:HTH_Tnp_Tc3_2 domain-containing protein [Trichonephila clavipes]